MRTERDEKRPRTVRKPQIDLDLLVDETPVLCDEFDIESIRCEGGEFCDVRGEGEIIKSVLRRVNFSQARFRPLTLVDVSVLNADLSNAVLGDVTARRVELVDSRGMGLRLSAIHLEDFSLQGCRLDYASIYCGQTKGAMVFQECSLREATLVGNWANVVFHDCDLSGVHFEITGAHDCDLRSSRLDGARGLLKLRGAHISRGQVIEIADQLAAEAGFLVSRD